MTTVDWHAGLEVLADSHPALAERAAAVATSTAESLAALAAGDLPPTVIHGDFMAEENVHYVGARLAGVIDFGVAHLDSRPYELAAARCYRAPELLDGYADELRHLGWPLSDQEEAAIVPVYRAFRLSLVAWFLDAGLRTGRFDTAAIEAELARATVRS